jgi:hypothetical protein
MVEGGQWQVLSGEILWRLLADRDSSKLLICLLSRAEDEALSSLSKVTENFLKSSAPSLGIGTLATRLRLKLSESVRVDKKRSPGYYTYA